MYTSLSANLVTILVWVRKILYRSTPPRLSHVYCPNNGFRMLILKSWWSHEWSFLRNRESFNHVGEHKIKWQTDDSICNFFTKKFGIIFRDSKWHSSSNLYILYTFQWPSSFIQTASPCSSLSSPSSFSLLPIFSSLLFARTVVCNSTLGYS